MARSADVRTAPPRVDRSRAELWVWPGTAGLAALVLALLLTELHPHSDTPPEALAWPGDVSAASAVLQTVATVAMTTLTLTFTLTVVSLQLASQQFSPRLLRNFLRDRMTKATLAVLVAAFVFALTVHRRLDADDAVPSLAMFVAMALSLASLAALLAFIQHITRRLRVDTMMLTVHSEAADAIDVFYPDYDDRPHVPEEMDLALERGGHITAATSGFIRGVHVKALVEAARREECVVQVESRPGDHVVRGTPLATVWSLAGDGGVPRRPDDAVLERLTGPVRAAVRVGYERTVEQDSAFGFRQLTDIAVKALSPGINDPVTADHAVGHTADLLVRLTDKRLGPTLHTDDDGRGRAVVPDRDIQYYLDLVCGQIRRYGEREPTVLMALLRMLRDVAVSARDDEHRAAIDRQVRLILDEVPPSLTEVDRASVEDLAARVAQVMAGDVWAGYRDRSGETRSM